MPPDLIGQISIYLPALRLAILGLVVPLLVLVTLPLPAPKPFTTVCLSSFYSRKVQND